MQFPRFGLVLPLHDPTAIAAAAMKASAAGFESVWMADHLYGIGAPEALDPWVTLATLALNNNIKTWLGSAVTDPHRRHPAVLAQTLATLDILSAGRMICGIGAGARINLDAYGFDASHSIPKLKEYIEILRLLWNRKSVTYHGQFFHLTKATIRPKPVQPEIPIWIAANSPQSLKLTGSVANGWVPVRASPQMMREDRKRIDASAKAADRDPETIITAYFLFIALGSATDTILETIRIPAKLVLLNAPHQIRRLGFALPQEAEPSPMDSLATKMEKANCIPDTILDAWMAFGSVEDVIAKIDQYITSANCHYFLLYPYITPSKTDFVKAFSEQVLPHFR